MKKIKQAIIIFLVVCMSVGCVFICGCSNSQTKTTSYDIVCSFDDGILTGKERVEFYNFTSNAFKEIKFNLFDIY